MGSTAGRWHFAQLYAPAIVSCGVSEWEAEVTFTGENHMTGARRQHMWRLRNASGTSRPPECEAKVERTCSVWCWVEGKRLSSE
ncbi:unnamed protein product [Arctogadus glacialis]